MRFMTREGTPGELRAQWERYSAYLEGVKDALPAEVREFACAEWHYDPDDPRCLHDARVHSIRIGFPEGASGSSIDVVVKGRSRASWSIRYLDAVTYEFVILGEPKWPPHLLGRHGDWLVDEVELTSGGLVVHRILFSNGGTWAVTCRTFSVGPIGQ